MRDRALQGEGGPASSSTVPISCHRLFVQLLPQPLTPILCPAQRPPARPPARPPHHFLAPRTTPFQAWVLLGSMCQVEPDLKGPIMIWRGRQGRRMRRSTAERASQAGLGNVLVRRMAPFCTAWEGSAGGATPAAHMLPPSSKRVTRPPPLPTPPRSPSGGRAVSSPAAGRSLPGSIQAPGSKIEK